MYTENTTEWWKSKISHEVSQFLEHPTHKAQQRLAASLSTYNTFINNNSNNLGASFDKHEELANH